MKPFEIDEGATYRVLITKPVTLETMRLLPRDQHKMQGSVLAGIVRTDGWEAIHEANPIA
ncbi:hypothetical protein [Aureimonas sp. AU40]|uniref:hypothetical protein n=1 Tax=Aureimonas sp. AU40 TaxID=1637747 RepID=UPI0007862193|nr:hypothetical protein [Aureimonas sp. AU40]